MGKKEFNLDAIESDEEADKIVAEAQKSTSRNSLNS